jgi:hypothetical protein
MAERETALEAGLQLVQGNLDLARAAQGGAGRQQDGAGNGGKGAQRLPAPRRMMGLRHGFPFVECFRKA